MTNFMKMLWTIKLFLNILMSGDSQNYYFKTELLRLKSIYSTNIYILKTV